MINNIAIESWTRPGTSAIKVSQKCRIMVTNYSNSFTCITIQNPSLNQISFYGWNRMQVKTQFLLSFSATFSGVNQNLKEPKIKIKNLSKTPNLKSACHSYWRPLNSVFMVGIECKKRLNFYFLFCHIVKSQAEPKNPKKRGPKSQIKISLLQLMETH